MTAPKVYVGAYACSEYDAGPTYGSFLLTPSLAARLVELSEADRDPARGQSEGSTAVDPTFT